MDRKSQVYEWVTAVCVALLILIVAVYAYNRWANAQVDPPADCSEYTGDSKTKCAGMMDWCSTLTGQDQEACNGAVGACMPAADAAGQYAATVNVATPVGRFNAMAPHLSRCVLAAQKVSPAGVAALINTNGDGKIPASAYPFVSTAEARGNIQGLADLAPSTVEWIMDSAELLPHN
jgi:hypothetical protein